MFSMLLVGCKKEEEPIVTVEIEEEEVNMFGLTETEQKIYAEYAAGVLMKYNAGSNMRILEGRKLEKEMTEEEAKRQQEEKRQQAMDEYAANKESDDEKQETADSSQSSSSSSSVSYISDMSEATGNSEFSIYYTGCEVTNSYPDSGEDVLLSVDASQGKVLLVTKFSVVNIGQETQNFDMFSVQPDFKLNLNGARYKAQYTLLLEDLSMYKGDIDAGTTVDTVLIFEIPEAEASNINDMELSIMVGNSTSLMELGSGDVSWTDMPADDIETEEMSDDTQLEETDIDIEIEEMPADMESEDSDTDM